MASDRFPSLMKNILLGCLALASFAIVGVSEVRADQCIVTCPDRQAFTDPRSCTTASAVRDCAPVCESRCGATVCTDISQYRCSPPTPSLAASTAYGSCSFTCDGSTTPPSVIIPCSTDTDCSVACDNTCATAAQHNRACGGVARCVPRAAATSSTTPAAAGGSTQGSSITLTNPLGANVTFQDIIARIIRAMIGLVGSIALLMFVYGGIRWMVAGGSEKEVAEAKNIIKYAVIGLLMILFSYTLVGAFLSAFTTGASAPTNANTNTNATP